MLKYEGAGREIGDCDDKKRHAGAAKIEEASLSGPFGTPVSNRGSRVPEDPRRQSECRHVRLALHPNTDFPPLLSLSSRSHSPKPYRVTMIVCVPHQAEAKCPVLLSPGRRETGLL